MNKTFSIVLVIVLVIAGYFLLKDTDKKIELENNTATELQDNETETGEAAGSVESSGDESVSGLSGTVDVKVESGPEEIIVIYSDSGYSPKEVNIKVGTVVTYKNESSLSMWPASAKHPSHSGYPTTGGCLGSTFDACRGVLPGESWSFQFDIAGSWGYHDHLKPSYFGKVVVE